MGCWESRSNSMLATPNSMLVTPRLSANSAASDDDDGSELVMGRYLLSGRREDTIGEGNSSICFRGRDIQSGNLVAVKIYKTQLWGTSAIAGPPDGLTLRQFKRQVAVMQELQEPFGTPEDPALWCDELAGVRPGDLFMNLLDFSTDECGNLGPNPSDGMLYIVTELAEYNLKSFIQQQRKQGQLLPNASVQHIAKEIIRVVAGLHAKGFVHLDLKPENLMKFPDGRLKLIDVDGCVRAGTDVSISDASLSFSPCYCSPDWARFLVTKDQKCIKATPSLDVWSVGVTICDLVSLQPTLMPKYVKFSKLSKSKHQTMSSYMRWLSGMERFRLPLNIVDFDVGLQELLMDGLLVPEGTHRKTLAECLSSPYIADTSGLLRLPSKLEVSSLSHAQRAGTDATIGGG